MAKKEGKGAAEGGVGGGANVLPIGSATCCVEKCTKKSDKLNFCPEHFMWFKEGLVSKKGEKPSDFDKKYQAFMLRKSAA